MHIHLCIGFLERREGPFLGLREFMGSQVLPRYPGVSVRYNSWTDDVAGEILRCAAGAGKLVLLGHSYGASALVRAAERMPGVVVDHLIMLDPVPRWLWGQFQWSSYKLPVNVRAATCIYNPISLPKSSPIRRPRGSGFRNICVAPFHASIPGDREVQGRVMEIIAGVAERECVRVPPVVRE